MKNTKKFGLNVIIIMIISILIIGNITAINNTASAADKNQRYQEEIFKYADKLYKKYNLQGASVALIKNGKM